MSRVKHIELLLEELYDEHVDVATNPKVNGGHVLVSMSSKSKKTMKTF